DRRLAQMREVEGVRHDLPGLVVVVVPEAAADREHVVRREHDLRAVLADHRRHLAAVLERVLDPAVAEIEVLAHVELEDLGRRRARAWAPFDNGRWLRCAVGSSLQSGLKATSPLVARPRRLALDRFQTEPTGATRFRTARGSTRARAPRGSPRDRRMRPRARPRPAPAPGSRAARRRANPPAPAWLPRPPRPRRDPRVPTAAAGRRARTSARRSGSAPRRQL